MSILETFYILFKGDTTDLKKGQKEAVKLSQELQDKIKSTNADTQDLGVSFLDLAQKAAGALGVVVGVGAAVKSVFSAEQQANQIGLFSKNLGVGVEQVDALSQATQRFGGTLESALGTAKQIQLGLTFQTPYGAGGDFTPVPTQLSIVARQYGIKAVPGMSVKDFYDEVNKKFQGLAPNQSFKIGAALGLDDSTILLLQQTTSEYNRIYEENKKIGLVTQENTDKARVFYQQWADITQETRNVSIEVGTVLLSNIKEIGAAFVIVGGIIATVLAPEIVAFTVALAVANAPVIAIGAAIAGVWALIHYGPDLVRMLENAFGVFFGKMQEWGSDALSTFKDWWGWLGKIINGVENFNPFKSRPTKDGQDQIDQYNKEELMYRAAKAIKSASSSSISAQSGSSIANSAGSNNNSVKIDNITVHTQATDAEGISSAIGGSLNKHINNTINNFNTSVRA